MDPLDYTDQRRQVNYSTIRCSDLPNKDYNSVLEVFFRVFLREKQSARKLLRKLQSYEALK